MSALTASDIHSLKQQLKTWERQFREREGRDPEKGDMKAVKEIADKYAAYNLARASGRTRPSSTTTTTSSTSSKPIPSGSSGSNRKAGPEVLSTPQKPSKPSRTAAKESKGPATTVYANANSPSKLRKLVASHSPRKNRPRPSPTSHANDPFGGTATVSPSLDGDAANPFLAGAGGRKAGSSPGLFGAMVEEREKAKAKKPDETPRTKARRFLNEGGSPLKKSTRTFSPFDDPAGGAAGDGDVVMEEAEKVPKVKGLGGFLRSNSAATAKEGTGSKVNGNGTSIFSQPQPSNSPQAIDHPMPPADAEDEEILGPSPFKPRPAAPSAFQFDSDSEEEGAGVAPGLASVFPMSPLKKAKAGVFDLGGSKKAMFGSLAPDEEGKEKVQVKGEKKATGKKGADEEFYADLEGKTEAEVASGLKGAISNKKGKKAPTKKQAKLEAEAKKPAARGKGKGKKTAAVVDARPIKRARFSQDPEASSGPGSDADADEDSLSRLPDLPNRLDASDVVAELDVYEFERDGRSEPAEGSKWQKDYKGRGAGKGKGKEKVAEKEEPTVAKEKLVGKSKVIIGRYRPFEAPAPKAVAEGDESDPALAAGDFLDSSSDLENEGAALRALRQKQALLDSYLQAANEAEDEEDVVVSEELMEVLSIRGSPGKTARIRARDHVERVRRVLGEQAARERELAKRKGLEDLEDDADEGSEADVEGLDAEESGDDDWQSEHDGWKDVDDGLLMDDIDGIEGL